MKKLLVASFVVLSLTSAGLYSAYEYGKAQPVVASEVSVVPPTADELLRLTNIERAKVGSHPLVLNESLSTSAQIKADDQTKNNYFGHVSPIDGKHGYEYITEPCVNSSENLVSGPGITSEKSIEWWMNSKPHREAMLWDDNDMVGFGISGQHVVAHYCNK